eukprot:4156234-Lingulodinium_polyedra.AAC.1
MHRRGSGSRRARRDTARGASPRGRHRGRPLGRAGVHPEHRELGELPRPAGVRRWPACKATRGGAARRR